jgi:polysaccharide export outer membrane protein
MKKVRVFYLGVALFTVCLFTTSCGVRKDVIYFQDIDKLPEAVYVNDETNYELKIMSNDNLFITVSALNPEAAEIFNLNTGQSGNSMNNNYQLRGFLVDEEGNINFPVIGQVHIAGLTKPEAIELIKSKISKYIEEPVVNIRFLNYKIFVLGEVSSPGSYTIDDEKVSIPEAIAMARDLTILGDRRNIVICRVENGEKKFFRVDLTSPEIFFSENYYLQQNDIVYVYPNGTKIRSARTYSPVISITASVLSLFFALYAFLSK